jgi:hypothetical protein
MKKIPMWLVGGAGLAILYAVTTGAIAIYSMQLYRTAESADTLGLAIINLYVNFPAILFGFFRFLQPPFNEILMYAVSTLVYFVIGALITRLILRRQFSRETMSRIASVVTSAVVIIVIAGTLSISIYAQSISSESNCEKIKVSWRRDMCYSDLFEKKGKDAKICAKIIDEDRRNSCLSQAQELSQGNWKEEAGLSNNTQAITVPKYLKVTFPEKLGNSKIETLKDFREENGVEKLNIEFRLPDPSDKSGPELGFGNLSCNEGMISEQIGPKDGSLYIIAEASKNKITDWGTIDKGFFTFSTSKFNCQFYTNVNGILKSEMFKIEII